MALLLRSAGAYLSPGPLAIVPLAPGVTAVKAVLVSSAGVAAVVRGVELAEVADETRAVVELEAIDVELPVAEAVALLETETEAEVAVDADAVTPDDGAAVVF